MKEREKFPQLNWLYTIFVILAGTVAVIVLPGLMTLQFYREWSVGQPISGGWNWPIVLIMNFTCILIIIALYWMVYRHAQTAIDELGIHQPSLTGMKTIAWSKVTNIEVFNGVGYHIYEGTKRIVVAPYAYKNPDAVIEKIHSYLQTIDAV